MSTMQTWQCDLAYMSAEIKTPLEIGDRLVMTNSADHVLRESVVGRFINVNASRPVVPS
jgi:hypothetical protein